jgi:hypothetical protein
MPPTHTDDGLVAAKTIRADHPSVRVPSQYIEASYATRLIVLTFLRARPHQSRPADKGGRRGRSQRFVGPHHCLR